ncbi:4-hydroxyphenylpyruvate dioxygenase [Leptolyngbya sp. AN03gr2]|uniref:4-hydroxyphenylpyruvate dioxygenase n=1 Tax=unclassified Leptolyngbya TaxID=2650499 RepID=UPI003D31DFAF
MSDAVSIQSFDHLELYVGNAKQAAMFYDRAFGFQSIAYRGLDTGSRSVASYVLQQGEIRLVLSAALDPDHPIALKTAKHGDHVAIIALSVKNVDRAFSISTARGALSAVPPTEERDENGIYRYATIYGYGNTLIKFVERDRYYGIFAPGFVPRLTQSQMNAGLIKIDHVVGNVEKGKMEHWVNFFRNVLELDLLVQFDESVITTNYSALTSSVMQNTTGAIKLPINEPAIGKGKSQIQEFLDYNHGGGVQHVAYLTHDIIDTVTKLKQLGIEFLNVPRSYYTDLEARIGKIDQSIEQLAELGILVDRDREGYLLQIFTRPVQDRPTLFFEIIERHGSQGFGEGNFKSLFEAIEREQALRGNL